MSRQRRTAVTGRITQQIIAAVRNGQTDRQIMDRMRARYGNVNLNQVRQTAQRYRQGLQRAQGLASRQVIRRMPLSEALGCPGVDVELRIVISYTDITGAIRQFADTITINASDQTGAIYQQLGRAAQRVINAANLNESTRLLYQTLTDDPAFDRQFVNARCLTTSR